MPAICWDKEEVKSVSNLLAGSLFGRIQGNSRQTIAKPKGE